MTMRHAGRRPEAGVTAVEYALVIGLISLVLVGVAASISTGFVSWADELVETIEGLLPGALTS